MKVAIAQIWQETNTFSPTVTDLHLFEAFRFFSGDDLYRCGWGNEIGGFIKAAQESQPPVEIVPLFAAGAWPAGRVHDDVMSLLAEKLIASLCAALPVDGVLLSLHGALASATIDDVDGYVTERVRQVIGPGVPLVISLDHHANITSKMMGNVDALVGYQSLPHDMFETGERAAKLMFRILKHEITPTVAWRKIPMITPADRFATGVEPLKIWFDKAREMEKRPGVVSVSLFPVQPWLDVVELGWTSVVITDGQPKLAKELADELAELAWSLREEFLVKKIPTAEAVAQAIAFEDGPVVIADGNDSVNSGAPGDSTWLLRELLQHKIGGPALVTVVDPDAVAQALAAGIGSQVTLSVGGKKDNLFSTPVTITGRVIRASDGRFTIYGHLSADINMGRTVVIDTGEVKVLLSEDVGSGHDPTVYRHLGLDPAKAKIVVVKTPVGFWRSYEGIMKHAILADCPGLSSSDLKSLPFKNAPRPLFPLDELEEWHPEPKVA